MPLRARRPQHRRGCSAELIWPQATVRPGCPDESGVTRRSCHRPSSPPRHRRECRAGRAAGVDSPPPFHALRRVWLVAAGQPCQQLFADFNPRSLDFVRVLAPGRGHVQLVTLFPGASSRRQRPELCPALTRYRRPAAARLSKSSAAAPDRPAQLVHADRPLELDILHAGTPDGKASGRVQGRMALRRNGLRMYSSAPAS